MVWDPNRKLTLAVGGIHTSQKETKLKGKTTRRGNGQECGHRLGQGREDLGDLFRRRAQITSETATNGERRGTGSLPDQRYVTPFP